MRSCLEIVQSVSGNLRFLPKSFVENMSLKNAYLLLYHSCHLLAKNINLFANIEESFCEKKFSIYKKNLFGTVIISARGSFQCLPPPPPPLYIGLRMLNGWNGYATERFVQICKDL